MKVISDGRGTGKTTKLLQDISKEYDNPVVVCNNPKHMLEKTRALGIHNITFITIDDILEDINDKYTNVFFDSIEDFLFGLFGPKVKGFTVNS